MADKKYFPGIFVMISLIILILAGCEGASLPEDEIFAGDSTPPPGIPVLASVAKSPIGNIEFAPVGYDGVRVLDTHLLGYAWGESVGWIKFGSTNCSARAEDQRPYYDDNQNFNAACWGVNRAEPDAQGNSDLSGYAWNHAVGWINFSPQGYPAVTIDENGNLAGDAWGQNVGWIRFQ
ncbi:hypothetical protein EPICR_10106 [Candidatus Desulfarcum epimagneticum]|uniref:Uncharacterized protein n=1 Tax=uncultured Desulfobacteraceae bacterium TaxID=218296 RepID=A0A484HIG0_9BACT|nr:hypothetical protein EPICR_10106 [uncultured Desulfobacteraceae bacterium]